MSSCLSLAVLCCAIAAGLPQERRNIGDLVKEAELAQAAFAEAAKQGKFPAFRPDAFDKAGGFKNERLSTKNPFVDSPVLEQDSPKINKTSEQDKWWEGKSDEDIAGRFKMTPEEFRKASDAILSWMDDRMNDLDMLYHHTVAIGKMTGVPVDRILDDKVNPTVSKWVVFAQNAVGNPFDPAHQASPDGHVFANPVKQMILDFRKQLGEAKGLLGPNAATKPANANPAEPTVDLRKLVDLSKAFMMQLGQPKVLSEIPPATATVEPGNVHVLDTPENTIDVAGNAVRLMDETEGINNRVDVPDAEGFGDFDLDALDSTRGVLD